MNSFNKKLTIAIEALLFVSLNSSSKPCSSKEICDFLGLKIRYIENLMQSFVKTEILKSVRGASGGYVLAKERRRIKILDVFEVIENLDNKSSKYSSESALKVISGDVISKVEKSIKESLKEITLEDIHNKSKNIKLHNKKKNKSDFVI